MEGKPAGFHPDNKENSVNKTFRLGKSGILYLFVSKNTVRKKRRNPTDNFYPITWNFII